MFPTLRVLRKCSEIEERWTLKRVADFKVFVCVSTCILIVGRDEETGGLSTERIPFELHSLPLLDTETLVVAVVFGF